MEELVNFFIKFSIAGAAEVQQQLGDVNKKIDNLTENLGKTGTGTKKVESGLGGLTKSVIGLATGFLALGKIMNGVFQANNDILALKNMADFAGVAAKNVEALAIATKKYGGTTESAGQVYGNLRTIQTKISQGLITDDQRIALARYGVKYTGKDGIASPDEMLENLARVLPRLSAGQRTDLGNALGLDKATILYLSKGIKNLRETLNDASTKVVLSGERQQQQAEKFQEAMQNLSLKWQAFVIELTPLLTAILDVLTPIVDLLGWFASAAGSIVDIAKHALGFSTDEEFAKTYGENRFVKWADRTLFPGQESTYDMLMRKANQEMLYTKTPLNTTRSVNATNQNSVSIGTVIVEDKTGTTAGRASTLVEELNQRFNALQLSPGLNTMGFK